MTNEQFQALPAAKAQARRVITKLPGVDWLVRACEDGRVECHRDDGPVHATLAFDGTSVEHTVWEECDVRCSSHNFNWSGVLDEAEFLRLMPHWLHRMKGHGGVTLYTGPGANEAAHGVYLAWKYAQGGKPSLLNKAAIDMVEMAQQGQSVFATVWSELPVLMVQSAVAEGRLAPGQFQPSKSSPLLKSRRQEQVGSIPR